MPFKVESDSCSNDRQVSDLMNKVLEKENESLKVKVSTLEDDLAKEKEILKEDFESNNAATMIKP